MGTAASKGNSPKRNEVKQIESDLDDYTPPPSLRRNENPKLQSASQLPKLPPTFDAGIKDVPRTIIGLEDSDDEENIRSKVSQYRNASDDKKLEKKLKRDIVDLENTLSDLEKSDGNVENSESISQPYGTLGRPSSIYDRDNDLNDFNQSYAPRSRNLPTASQRRASYGVGAKGLRQYPRQQSVSQKHVSSIKFSWQENGPSLDKDNEEEWTYKQVFKYQIPLIYFVS